ncbi:MAG: VOC family protein [Dehalococcoidia bacterium]
MTLSNDIEAKRKRLEAMVDRQATTPTRGVNHVAVVSADLERAARFYRDVLGMPLVSVAPNRDEPRSTHINIDLGNGVGLSLFDFPNVTRPAVEGVGGLMHLALSLPRERLEAIEARAKKAGLPIQRIGDSLYFHDPDGLMLELTLVDG